MNQTRVRRTKRVKRGMGRLFKLHSGRQYPPDWQGKAPFYLAVRIGGKRIVQPLRGTDGEPIYDRAAAEQERLRQVGPTLAGDKVEALKAIQARLADAQTVLASTEQNVGPEVRIAEAWRMYLADKTRPDSGESTLSFYALQWGRFSRWIAKQHPEILALREVTPAIASEYVADLDAAGSSGATVNKHVGLLRLVWRILADAAGVVANPWSRIVRRKHRPHNRRELTTAELQRICESATGEMRVLLALGIYTGMRRGDCATLRWDEVDMPRGYIQRVPQKTARTSGRAVTVPIHPTLSAVLREQAEKSRGAEYVLPETADLYFHHRDILTDRIQRHFWDNGIDCHTAGTGQRIMRDAKGNPIRNDDGRVRLAETGKRAVVVCGFHSLRHSFVSLCRAAGAPLSVVEALVGHSNPTMTRVYSHTSETEAARAVAALPSVTGGKTVALTRDPLPTWARVIVENMTEGTWQDAKSELLSR